MWCEFWSENLDSLFLVHVGIIPQAVNTSSQMSCMIHSMQLSSFAVVVVVIIIIIIIIIIQPLG